MGESCIRPLLTAYPHTYTQTHPSTYCWALLEAPQILIRSDVTSGPGLDKGSALNPTLSTRDPFPHPHAQRLLRLSFPTTSPLAPHLPLITVSVPVRARWALSKQILPPACFVYCGGGRRRGGRRGLGIRRLFTSSEKGVGGCRGGCHWKNHLYEQTFQSRWVARHLDSLYDGIKTKSDVGCKWRSEAFQVISGWWLNPLWSSLIKQPAEQMPIANLTWV